MESVWDITIIELAALLEAEDQAIAQDELEWNQLLDQAGVPRTYCAS